MSRQPSRATANRSNHPHGTDPRFQRTDYSRTSGAERPADAYGHLRRSGGYRDRNLSRHFDRVGAARADTPQRRAKRHQFIQELLTALPIHPITVQVALRTGQIDGENQAKGVRLPLSDLLIGVTALELGYSVATANLRHFQMIRGLKIVSL